MRASLRLLVASLLLGGAIAAAAQEEPAAAPPVFVETIDVTVVNVEVYVTDKDGNRVSDLGPEDFVLYEDGRPVAISNFYAVEDRRPVAPAPIRAEVGVPAEAAPPPPASVATPEDQRLHLVVYVDNANIEPFHRNNVYRHLYGFLRANLSPGDRVAVYTFEQALHLRQPFTEDIGRVVEVLRETERLSAHGLSRETERNELLRDIDRARSPNEVQHRLRMYGESIYNDNGFTLGALSQMIDGLAGLPGRKAVLYVSDGMPVRPAEDLYSAFGDKFGDPSAVMDTLSWDLTRQIEGLAQEANASRVTFYTIEAAGLRNSMGGTADTSLSRSYGGLDLIRRQNWQAPLQTLAHDTGGLAILGTSNFTPQLRRIGTDLDTYYSLGYQAPHGGDGRYHEIKVEVKRKGVDLRYRTGYTAHTPVRWMSDRTRAALVYDANANPLEVELEVDPAKSDRGELLVPIVVRIPIRNITLVPDQQNRWHGSLKLYLAVVDDEGRTAQVDDQPWTVVIPSDKLEQALGMKYAHEVSLQMRPGPANIAVGVRDEIAAHSSFLTRRVNIGAR